MHGSLKRSRPRPWLFVLPLAAYAAAAPSSATNITSPKQAFEQEPGSDYFVADYDAYEAYLKQLVQESDRIKLIDFGRTSEGRTQWMAVVSAPENLQRLDDYKAISRQLALGSVTEAEARHLAAQGRAIVWIAAGQHANESVPMQGQIQVLYRMLTQGDPETLRILKDVILLFVASNPDGMEMFADWYMRRPNPLDRRRDTMPTPYQRFVGHDNNRDFYMSHMPETTNINRALFREWFPQLLLDQHQMGLPGGIVFISPENEPINYHQDPAPLSLVNEANAAITARLEHEGMGGVVTRTAVPPFTLWANGPLMIAARFHNVGGVLSEINGGATPERIGVDPDLLLPRHDNPMPVEPQLWHQRQSIAYQWTINRALMDYASRNRERLLYDSYRMAAAATERGLKDSWTPSPSKVEELRQALAANPRANAALRQELFKKIMRDPKARDPRAYIVPARQRDTPTAVAFLNALIKSGVRVERAARAFVAGDKSYPAGTWVVRTAQPYRAHVLDMFEPQEYPHVREYPGGPPKKPFDVTGYTLAYQMGVQFEPVLSPVNGSFEDVRSLIAPPPGEIAGKGRAGWIVGHETNASFILTNRLLKAGLRVDWLATDILLGSRRLAPGAIWIPHSAPARAIVETAVRELGISAYRAGTRPKGEGLPLVPVRIGVVDRFGGVTTSGWTQWLLEQFEFPYRVVYPQQINEGGLRERFDVLLFTDGTMRTDAESPFFNRCCAPEPPLESIPAQYRTWTGEITNKEGLPALRSFVERGGTAIAMGSSAVIADHFTAPVAPALARVTGEKITALDPRDFYIPGSLLRTRIDPSHPLGYGMPSHVDMSFNRAQSFRLTGGSASKVAWFDEKQVLRSGFAIGQERLLDTAAVVDATVGRGKLILVGPDIVNRAQSYGTFKLLFNGLLYGPAVAKRQEQPY